MDRLPRHIKRLGLAAYLAGLPTCGGNHGPVLLLKLNLFPPETAHFVVRIEKGGRAGEASYFRNMSNVYGTSFAMPQRVPGPSSTTVALDLPAGTEGAVLVKVTVFKPEMTNMNTMVGPIMSYEMGSVGSRSPTAS